MFTDWNAQDEKRVSKDQSLHALQIATEASLWEELEAQAC